MCRLTRRSGPRYGVDRVRLERKGVVRCGPHHGIARPLSDPVSDQRGDITMAEKPAANPNVDDIADRAKHGYANATQVLAATQYRLAELAGTGRLDPDESMSLQTNLFHLWQALYAGTLGAVRDWATDDCTWDEVDNTYSHGRQVRIQIRIEPEETSDSTWQHNRFLLGDGAVNE